MRVVFTIICVCQLCWISSCKKTPRTPYDDVKDKSTGYITATINGNKWASSFGDLTVPNGKVHFSGTLYINGIARQGLYFDNVQPITSVQQKMFSMYDSTGREIPAYKDSLFPAFYLNDDDVLEGSYYVSNTGNDNYLVLDEYNTSTHKSKGHFQMTLFTRDNPTQGFPDTLKVTNGYFELAHRRTD